METLEELLTEELRDLYDAEKQIVRALPKLTKAVTNEELKQALQEHLEVTKGQVQRLEQVFELLGQKAKNKPCEAMKGLLLEGQQLLEEDATEDLLDTAIIGATQKVEHYEISGYGTVRALAEKIGNEQVADLLQQTLDEEKEADEKLTQIATQVLDEMSLGDEEDLDDDSVEQTEETAAPKTVKKKPSSSAKK